jgi:hypothetical protein
LFASASATLLELGHSRLGARLGITMVLHTWARDLSLHPHVHAIVTAGGLALDGSCFKHSSTKFLFHVDVMGKLLRGKMIAALRKRHREGAFDGFEDFVDPEAFERLMTRLAAMKWLTYAKKPFREVRHVLSYLGRYTHRVAIANSRLVNVTDDAVTFRTKSGKTATLQPIEFLRRFVQHVLPDGLHKIRHYGLYASAHAKAGGLLHVARAMLPAAHDSQQLAPLIGLDFSRCPACGGLLQRVPLEPATMPAAACRGPPRRLAA